MGVTVVVGGQFGSEGKGKVAQYWASQCRARAVVRVGGSNSGHTGYDGDGSRVVLRQLPTAALLPGVLCVVGPGSYIDVELLCREIARTGIEDGRLIIDERASIILPQDIEAEQQSDLQGRIGSTASGTGASVARRVARQAGTLLARDVPALQRYVGETTPVLRDLLAAGDRVIVEGTQGFGLSLLQSPYFPYTTSRDTSAAGAVAEAGLSPMDVDEVVLVLRAFPIRVGGRSGPLPHETSWENVTESSGSPYALEEFTSVTGRLRRIAEFDADIVKRAIMVNRPTSIVMNHVDYVDAAARNDVLTRPIREFLDRVEDELEMPIELIGLGPTSMVSRRAPAVRLAHA